MITPEDLRTLAAERQATLRREAAVARLIGREGARRPIRIVQPIGPRLAVAAATIFALAGSLRMER